MKLNEMINEDIDVYTQAVNLLAQYAAQRAVDDYGTDGMRSSSLADQGSDRDAMDAILKPLRRDLSAATRSILERR